MTLAVILLASPASGQRDSRIHSHGLFLGVGAAQLTLDSDALLPPDEDGGSYGAAGHLGYGLGDYIAVVLSGDLARLDLTHQSETSEFEFAHIALSARVHPLRVLGRIGPFIEGSWLRYAATTDRTVAPSSARSRVTLEGTGAAAGAGLHVFLSGAVSIEAAATWTDGELTKASGVGAQGTFTPVPLRSRLYRLGVTWWLGT